MTIKIEKGIPLTPKKADKIVYPFHQMVVGDSFCVPTPNRVALAAASYNFAKRHGVKFALRKVDGGVRVWRTA